MLRRSQIRALVPLYNFGHTDLNVAFNTSTISSQAPPPKDAGVKISTLSNGARLVTHDKEGPHSAVGIYCEAGPKYDPKEAPGMSYVMRHALQCSNFDNSMYQIDRQVRATGASTEHCEVRKRLIGTKIESRRDMWQKNAANIFASFAAPRLAEPDVQRFRDAMDNVFEELRLKYPRKYVVEQLENVAFYREPLGNPRHVFAYNNDASNHLKLVKHWSAMFIPSRIIVAGVNVPHEELIAAYENAPFQHSAKAPHHVEFANKAIAANPLNEAGQYTGGQGLEQEARYAIMGTHPDMKNETIVAVGWRAAGRETNVKEYAATLVAQQLVSMANRESLAGTGGEIAEMGNKSFYSAFTSAGIFGNTIRAKPEYAVQQTTEFLREFPKMAKGNIAAAVERAAIDFYGNELEVVRDYVDHLAASLQPQGTSRIPADEVLAAINAVRQSDVDAVFKFATDARPALFATGEVANFPSLKQLGF